MVYFSAERQEVMIAVIDYVVCPFVVAGKRHWRVVERILGCVWLGALKHKQSHPISRVHRPGVHPYGGYKIALVDVLHGHGVPPCIMYLYLVGISWFR